MTNLQGEHIILRAPERNDLDTLYNWENDTLLWQVSNTLVPFSRFVLEQYLVTAHLDIYTNKQQRLMICDKNDVPLGCVDLYDFDPFHQRAGVGIVIAEPHRNKGYADDALKTLIRYSFETLCLRQLFCAIGESNMASMKLFENNGFERIGLRRDWLRVSPNTFESEWSLQLINPLSGKID